MTHEQLLQLQQAVQDRYAFIAAQIQSEDYLPDPAQLERWKKLGLVPEQVTVETFASNVPAEMRFIRNAFVLGRVADAVEQGATFEQAMRLAVSLPLKRPDKAAIAIAEKQTAMYLQDNAQELASKIGQIAIKQRNDTIRKMAVDFHSRKLKRTARDEDKKQEAGEEIPERYVENWQQFQSELYHALEDKSRDLARVAYYEITDAQKQGQAQQLLGDGNVDKYVYKKPLQSACPQCKYLYLMPDGKTPRLFRLSDMISQGTNIGRKAHPTKAGKVVPGGRTDGAETMKAVAGLVHPWCACLGPFMATGYEYWMTPEQKRQVKQQREQRLKKGNPNHDELGRFAPYSSGRLIDHHNAAKVPNMKPVRTKWENFPDVMIHSPIESGQSAVKKHPDYDQAKTGDAEAAERLVQDNINTELIRQISKLAETVSPKPILVSVHAYESFGLNAIPEALAAKVSDMTGLELESGIVQTNIVGHTKADGFTRLSRQAAFNGEVKAGSNYILIDDFVGQGGTLANLKGFIESNGGKVMAAVTLTGKPHSARLALRDEQLKELRDKHGSLESWWENKFGHSFDSLTQSEARYLAKTKDADTIRNRIAEAE